MEAIADMIRSTYEKEKAPDAISLDLNGNTLKVKVHYCPGVKHLHAIGRVVSPWYKYTTIVVMKLLAEKAGATFEMISYDEETGAAEYRFN